MDGDQLLPIAVFELLDRGHDLDPRVRNQHVDAAEPLGHVVDSAVDLRLVGDVHRHTDRACARAVELPRGRLSAVQVDIGDGDLGAVVMELSGDFLADAAGGAGDDGDLVLQAHAKSLPKPGRARRDRR
jgi:hypothetical protein